MNADIAHQAASRDRAAHADQTMEVACREAIRLLRGDPDRTQITRLQIRRVLARAERSASRVIGAAA